MRFHRGFFRVLSVTDHDGAELVVAVGQAIRLASTASSFPTNKKNLASAASHKQRTPHTLYAQLPSLQLVRQHSSS